LTLAETVKPDDETMRESDDEGSRSRERRDIVSGEILPEENLVRFAVSPDGEIVPDLGAVLPGRGIWVRADAASIATAVKKNLFARAAKAQVKVAPDLATRVEQILVNRMKADLGLALRAGALHLGFDQVAGALKSDAPPVLVVSARDGSADGKRKIFAAGHARGLKIEAVDCLTSTELSLALGRENVIHAALKSGRLQERLSFDAKRLNGFRIRPEVSHERAE
jgi:predicted RNA-binding protein YlxR (DUF448 family)